MIFSADSIAEIIEGDDITSHWKTKTKEPTKGGKASTKTISFTDCAKKRSMFKTLILLRYFTIAVLGSNPT